jgi:hypothetical protein
VSVSKRGITGLPVFLIGTAGVDENVWGTYITGPLPKLRPSEARVPVAAIALLVLLVPVFPT